MTAVCSRGHCSLFEDRKKRNRETEREERTREKI
jgi:hypothetical protein